MRNRSNLMLKYHLEISNRKSFILLYKYIDVRNAQPLPAPIDIQSEEMLLYSHREVM